MSKTLVANTNLAAAPANSVKANITGSSAQPTDLILGTNQFVGNTGSGLTSVILSAGNGISLTTSSNVLAVNVIGSGVPTGAIMPFYLSVAPSGWRACDGTTITNSGDTAALYALIGSTLPDLRGYFIRGFGTNGDGTASAALGVKQTANSVIPQDNGYTVNGAPYNAPGYLASPYDGAQGHAVVYSINSTPRNFAGGDPRPKNIAFLYCIKL